jgi:hypothetical protein
MQAHVQPLAISDSGFGAIAKPICGGLRIAFSDGYWLEFAVAGLLLACHQQKLTSTTGCGNK